MGVGGGCRTRSVRGHRDPGDRRAAECAHDERLQKGSSVVVDFTHGGKLAHLIPAALSKTCGAETDDLTAKIPVARALKD